MQNLKLQASFNGNGGSLAQRGVSNSSPTADEQVTMKAAPTGAAGRLDMIGGSNLAGQAMVGDETRLAEFGRCCWLATMASNGDGFSSRPSKEEEKKKNGGFEKCEMFLLGCNLEQQRIGQIKVDLGKESDLGRLQCIEEDAGLGREADLGRAANRRGQHRFGKKTQVWAGKITAATSIWVGKTMTVRKKDVDGVMEDGSRGGGDADRWRWRRMQMEEGEMDADRLQQTEKKEEEAGDLAMGGQRLDLIELGRWDDGGDGTMAGDWLVAGGGGRAGKMGEKRRVGG
ncbi:hypothetical protein ACLOJK_028209 [Asimina triloba]